MDVAQGLVDSLPVHKGSLSIEHNGHKTCYESLSEYIERQEADWGEDEDSAKSAALLADEIWEIWWCPDTPVGSCLVASATLAGCVELAKLYDR